MTKDRVAKNMEIIKRKFPGIMDEAMISPSDFIEEDAWLRQPRPRVPR